MKRAPEALWRMTADYLVLRRPGGKLLTVTGPGPHIWELLADDISREQLNVVLAERFSVPVEVVAADVAPVIDLFIHEGLIDP